MPIITGESIVLRILDNGVNKKDLNNIGFDEKVLGKVKKSITKSNGLILVTGPTGSGKTTTLYSILNELNDNSKKIMTIEDPVEYQIKGIQQISINNEIGLKFNDVLKNILRQDPDIIMIGEIRDEESLSIAIQASLTGHLVLSTLHTNDSVSTISRLIDLNAKPYLVASTLKAVIAQRLVLKLCCEDGCSKCNYTKFDGRVSLFEFLEFDENISSMVSKSFDKSEILKYALNNGFKTLNEDAKEKIEKRLTTLEEVNKVLF
jgi:general secretion pathway protein E